MRGDSPYEHVWGMHEPKGTWICLECGATLVSYARPYTYLHVAESHESVFGPFEEALRGGGQWMRSDLPSRCPRFVSGVMES